MLGDPDLQQCYQQGVKRCREYDLPLNSQQFHEKCQKQFERFCAKETQPGIFDETPLFLNPIIGRELLNVEEEPFDTKKLITNIVFLENNDNNLQITFRIRSVHPLKFQFFKNYQRADENRFSFQQVIEKKLNHTIMVKMSDVNGLYDAGTYTWFVTNGEGWCWVQWDIFHDEKLKRYPTSVRAPMSKRSVLFDRVANRALNPLQLGQINASGRVNLGNPWNYVLSPMELPPQIHSFYRTDKPELGETWLIAVVSSPTDIAVIWGKYNDLLVMKPNNEFSKIRQHRYAGGARKEGHLIIRELTKDDRGIYVCFVTNNYGFDRADLYLLDVTTNMDNSGEVSNEDSEEKSEEGFDGIIRYEWDEDRVN